MDNFDLKIAEAERRLEKRQEILVNQFVVMEKLLSGLMAQQQWLTGQINSLGS
jgi:flagellar capping protein FliD